MSVISRVPSTHSFEATVSHARPTGATQEASAPKPSPAQAKPATTRRAESSLVGSAADGAEQGVRHMFMQRATQEKQLKKDLKAEKEFNALKTAHAAKKTAHDNATDELKPAAKNEMDKAKNDLNEFVEKMPDSQKHELFGEKHADTPNEDKVIDAKKLEARAEAFEPSENGTSESSPTVGSVEKGKDGKDGKGGVLAGSLAGIGSAALLGAGGLYYVSEKSKDQDKKIAAVVSQTQQLQQMQQPQ